MKAKIIVKIWDKEYVGYVTSLKTLKSEMDRLTLEIAEDNQV